MAGFFTELSEGSLQSADLAIVASPNRFHSEQALFCLSLGIPVVIEKPACFTLKEAERIIATARSEKTPFWYSAASTFRRDVHAVGQLASQGALGEIFHISLSWRRAQGVPRPGSWFTNKDMAIGGSGADIGWHLLDVGLGYLGYPPIQRGIHMSRPLSAVQTTQGSTWYGSETNPKRNDANNQFDVENHMAAALSTHNCHLTLLTSWSSQQRFDATEIRVLGTKAEVDLDCSFGFSPNGVRNSFLKIFRNGSEDRQVFSEARKIDPYIRFAEHVASDLVEGGCDLEHEATKLRSLSSAMQVLYPQV